jgi:hypothetical protein
VDARVKPRHDERVVAVDRTNQTEPEARLFLRRLQEKCTASAAEAISPDVLML